MRKYNPDLESHRQELAQTVQAMLTDMGFRKERVQSGRYETKEDVFSIPESPGSPLRVAVYTSTVNGTVRGNGKDAIRVVALYRNREGNDKGVAKASKRVNRTGDIMGICQRLADRITEVWQVARTGDRCHCGAPLFISQKGNAVCADICWKH
jgi:hypothetical protein